MNVENVKVHNVPEEENEVNKPLFGEIWAVDNYEVFDAKTFIPKLSAGDEVWIRTELKGYSHVALYIGFGEIVHVSNVQKSGLKIGKTMICREELSKVAEGQLVGYRKTNADSKLQNEIIERALKDVGKVKPYLLSRKNCEHQVLYWITGIKKFDWITSTQIKDYIVIGAAALIIGMIVGLLTLFLATEYPAYIATLGAIGIAVATCILVIGAKYVITAIEHIWLKT